MRFLIIEHVALLYKLAVRKAISAIFTLFSFWEVLKTSRTLQLVLYARKLFYQLMLIDLWVGRTFLH